jgi:hypothetical protein
LGHLLHLVQVVQLLDLAAVVVVAQLTDSSAHLVGYFLRTLHRQCLEVARLWEVIWEDFQQVLDLWWADRIRRSRRHGLTNLF